MAAGSPPATAAAVSGVHGRTVAASRRAARRAARDSADNLIARLQEKINKLEATVEMPLAKLAVVAPLE